MVIECPYCSTRFRLDERSLGARRPTLRCSRCRRTFPLPPPPEPQDDDEPFAYEDDDDLGGDTVAAAGSAFDDDPEEADDAEDEEEIAVAPVVAPRPTPRAEQFDLPIGRDDAQPSLFGDRGHHIDDDEYSIDEPLLFVDDDRDADASHRAADDEDYEEPSFAEESVRHAVQIKSVLAFIALVVAAYAVFGWTLRSEPQWARSLMQQVPIIGSEINAVELGREVVLDDLHGRYEHTKEGKLIFLITGKARNEHDQAVRGIRVEFQLLGGDGKVLLARQSTTCGNAMRPDLVRDLTEEQVRILRGWGTKPPEETAVKPGESCPIVSIFMDVARDVTSFSGEVVQARRLS